METERACDPWRTLSLLLLVEISWSPARRFQRPSLLILVSIVLFCSKVCVCFEFKLDFVFLRLILSSIELLLQACLLIIEKLTKRRH